MAKQEKEVPSRPITELYGKFRLLPYEKYFKVLAAKNHTATLEEVESAIKEISQTNKLDFVRDIDSINRGESLKDEDKERLAETRRALKEIGYESSVFYDILFETVKTDFDRRGFVNKVCNALTEKTKTDKPITEEKYSKKLAEAPLPTKNEEKKEEEMPYYTGKVAISPNMLAQKLGIPLYKVKKILKETNPQLTVNEEGVTVSATLPWDKI